MVQFFGIENDIGGKKTSLMHTMPLFGFFGIKTENPVFCTNLPITSF